MSTIQTDISFLVKYKKDEPWEIAFVSPLNQETLSITVGNGGEVEAGPRLYEVLQAIEKDIVSFPRYIDAEELKSLGLFVPNDLFVKLVGDQVLHIEIGVKTQRLFQSPKRLKVRGKPTEGPELGVQTTEEAFGNNETDQSFQTNNTTFTIQSETSTGNSSNKEPSEPGINASPVEIRYVEPDGNTIDIPPLDDRLEEFASGKIKDRVRIGDVALVIPPLAIQVNRKSNLQKIKTLRSKSSMITKAGSSITTITLQLYFHDLESINGRKVKAYKDRYYYMDGLRPLIAQFKKAPFLPIDNEYINDVLGIHNVALVDLTVSTVPGFPHSLSATLTLAKFDLSAYMPQVEFLGDVIHYPMLRWYYQECMKEPLIRKADGSIVRNPYRTYLAPIEGEITNEFVFQLADEDQLEARQASLQYVMTHRTPAEVKDAYLDISTESGKQVQDSKEAGIILEQYRRYQDLKKKGLIPTDVSDDKNRIWMAEPADAKGQSLYRQIYGDRMESNHGSFFHPYESYIIVNELPRVVYTPGMNGSGELPITEYGYASLRYYSERTRNKFPAAFESSDDEQVIFISMTEDNVKKLEEIQKNGEEIQKRADEEIQLFEQHQSIVEQTEADLKLNDVPISGLIPTSVSVMYENQFSMVHVQDLDTPTLQYLGCQDPSVYVSFEANEFAVQAFRELLEKADEYSRKYRLGITSGFLGIRNSLLQLFGITTVMVENAKISTVPGFPGRYQIELTLCGFNKTQKRMEQLEGISPIYRGTSPETRTNDSFDPQEDMAIIEYHMKDMEAYPDLELPTYEELQEALPYIDEKIDSYNNKVAGKYVDPDFYISTQWTFRERIREQREKDNRLYFQDTTGVQGSTSPMSASALDVDMEALEIISNLGKEATKINPEWSWSGAAPSSSSAGSNGNKVVFASKEVANLVQNNRSKLMTLPSYNEWVELGMGTDPRSYDDWASKVKTGSYPSEFDVYRKIYELVDKYWTNKGLVYDDKNTDSAAWQKVTYSAEDDLYRAYQKYLHSKNPKIEDVKEGKLSVSDLKSTDYKISRERLANLIKAMLDVRSRWKQFNTNGKPKLDYDGNLAGIAGVPLSREAKTAQQAKRLLWDWEYNMEVAFESMFRFYDQASKIEKATYMARPWDWMIHAYDTGSLDGKFGNFYIMTYRKYHMRYGSYQYRYATPTQIINMDIAQYKGGDDYNNRVIYDESSPEHRQALIEDLLNAGYRESLFSDKEETRRYLESLPYKELKKLYEDYLGFVKGANKNLGLFDKEVNRFNRYEEIQNIRDDITKLVNRDDPQTLFYDMFTDMLLYDQRGRLLRAFPTFYMFIIDEGRWLGSYRLWDNLYGFNAIESIDVHKSRKVAADTAIITMTNVYSNLTSIPIDARKGNVELNFWDNIFYEKDNKKLLEERKELLTSMFLTPGARIHLRMGYGSSVPDLPIVFNGTITEMDVQEVVTIVAQGDGIELTNIISGDPDDNNDHILWITEPRDLICELLTSKGNWLKDVINAMSDNNFFKDNPLGIMHFGTPGKTPPGNLYFFNNDYGEAAQNIYSANGIPTMSQWVYQDGTLINIFNWDETPRWNFIMPIGADEPNIIVPFYNNTVWDIVQTIAYCTPDYIAAVHPFELRSTLFYGKPYWRIAWRYDSRYEYDQQNKRWIRYVDNEHRKPFMQFRYFDSQMDIVSNKIKASEEGVHTVVIVNYDGKQTPAIYADYDIRFDKQKTAVVDAKIISRMPGLDFWTSEKQALYYGCSTLRDYIKDIYKGELLVLGDPTLKPHDFCYLNDTVSDMNGGFQVKAVTHHFSFESGFVSSIQPDMLAVIDDMAVINIFSWGIAFGSSMAAQIIGLKYLKDYMRKMFQNSLFYKQFVAGKGRVKEIADKVLQKATEHLKIDDPDFKQFIDKLNKYAKLSPDDISKKSAQAELEAAYEKVKSKITEWDKGGKFKNAIDKINAKNVATFLEEFKNIQKGGSKALSAVKKVVGLGSKLRPLLATNLIGLAVSIGVETLFEMYRRNKATFQAIIAWPMRYHGREFSAGITGHKGMVVGDTQMGKIDSLLSGLGFDGKKDGNLLEWFFDALNFLADDNKKFLITREDLNNR